MNSSNKRPVIALAQIGYFDTAESHNVAKIKDYIKKAARAGADIVCFPETCVHQDDVLFFDHALVAEICSACKENNIWAIITDVFRVSDKDYKISILIDRKGEIVGDYKKINLYGDEAQPGNKIFVHQADFATIGIVVCWDLAFPELFSKMKREGAEIVFCPSYWCYEKVAHEKDHRKREQNLLRSLVLARAFENLFFVAYVNPVFNNPELVSYSAIACPHNILKEIKDREGLIVQEINLREIQKFERLYPNKKQ